MMHCVITICAFIAGFCGILYLFRSAVRENRARQEAEIREMLRQDKRRENREWYISTRQNDARADLIRVWANLEVR